MNDEEILLMTLSKERQQLHDRIMQIDRIVKRIKNGEFAAPTNVISIEAATPLKQPDKSPHFPKNAALKVQILKVFDFLGKASKLQDIQSEYDKLNESHYPLRDTMRSLQTAKLLVLIKERNALRGFLWAKREWVSGNRLLPEYRPEGFELLYDENNLVFE